MGWPEARPLFLALLRARPSREVIEAIERVADEACLVLLDRVARTVPALAACAMDVLASCEHPRAASIIRSVTDAGHDGRGGGQPAPSPDEPPPPRLDIPLETATRCQS